MGFDLLAQGAPLERMRHIGEGAGLGALYLFCLGAFLSPPLVSVAMGLLALALLFAATDWRALLRQPAVLMSLVLAAYILLQSLLSAWRTPALAGQVWSGAVDWLRLLLFIPFGYFLGSDPRRLGQLLALVLAGLILGMFWRLDWGLLLSQPERFLSSRYDYGFVAIAFGLYSSAAVLGLVLLARRWWGGDGLVAVGIGRGLLWLACLAIMLQGLVLTYSRGSWIAFALALATGLWLAHRQARGSVQVVRAPRLFLFLVVATLAAMVVLNAERLTMRVTEELDTAGQVVDGQNEVVSQSSFGLRWNAQLFGFTTWLQRPLLGWGAKTSRPLMRESGNPRLISDNSDTLKHLHNTYLEILVQFGLIGLALFGLLVVLLWRGLASARRAGRIPADYYSYLVALLVLTLVWCLFDYRAVHHDWRTYWILLGGALLSFAMPARSVFPASDDTREVG